jgi:hypothetical protein
MHRSVEALTPVFGFSAGHCAVLPRACAGTALVSVKPLTGPNIKSSTNGPAERRDQDPTAAAAMLGG